MDDTPFARYTEISMKICRQNFGLLAFWLGMQGLLLPSLSHAAEIKVTLFGQPCTLKGPPSAAELKSIHLISPEQLFGEPSDSESASKQQSLAVLNRLLKSAPVPSSLDRYKERLKKRLEAQIDFFDSLDEYKQTGKFETLSGLIGRRVVSKSQKDFETLLRKTPPKELFEQKSRFFENFNDVIEPDPEEDFHRGIQKINVQYVCAFDEGTGKSGGESSE
jgi:hypothetical protein